MKTFTAPIASIRRDGGTQIRAALDEATVVKYAEAMRERGVKLPPIRVFDDNKTLWLSDGFHRVEASLRLGAKDIEVERLVGGQREALLDAIGANAAHGLPRSNADKRRAVECLLADEEWGAKSDSWIAKTAHVDPHSVARWREEGGQAGNSQPAMRQGSDGKEYPAKQRPRDSKPGQPTAAPVPAANPADEGEKAAGEPRNGVLPAADEPPAGTWSCDKCGYAQFAGTPCNCQTPARDRLINVERLLRDAQAEIAPLLAKGEAMALQGALTDALRVVRVALGDGYEVRVRFPVTLEPAPPVLVIKVPEKVGRYSPPEKRIHIELPDGREYEPIDDTDAF